ncbi:hypothetical protein [Thioalkalivibrio sp. XN279]|uniref:hypothetical protein n=1 Tax=Thioalkalivibrio sp. XN279 TaxID=2714953 RepID=UPI00140E0058|nr:hypothetical protein [Thioalkalivibrio sp. XN279]NHA14152.1 hypothetical protein [Thioalkalivibrio sp. XN279]
MQKVIDVFDEAEWLVGRMNLAGVGNADLQQSLQENGWTGQPNNIANWRNGSSPIPSPLVPLIVKATGLDPEIGEGKVEVIRFFRHRYPFLATYLQDPGPSESRKDSGAKARTPTPVYYARRGVLKGKRFVPHRNRDGFFVAGTSRFEKDQVTFETLKELVDALAANPDLRVRMAPEDQSAPPSLITQRSLAWE